MNAQLTATLLLGITLAGAVRADEPVKLTLVEVRDPMMNNTVAFTMLVPEGWQCDAAVEWRHHQSNLAVGTVRIASPDGRVMVECFPIVPCTWQEGGIAGFAPGSTYLGNVVYPPIFDAAQYVGEAILPFYRADVQMELVGREPLAGVAAAVAQSVAEPGVQKQVIAERLRARYEHAGRAYEEDFYVTLVYAFGQVLDRQSVLWQANNQYSFGAPAGELDDWTPLLTTVVSSMRIQPDWHAGYCYVQQLWMDNQRQAIRNAGELSRKIAQNAEEIRQMYRASYENAQRSSDAVYEKFSEAIRGVETYDDPVTGRTVQLPSDYQDVWISDRGDYILANDANFDPNAGDTANWQRANPTPHPNP